MTLQPVATGVVELCRKTSTRLCYQPCTQDGRDPLPASTQFLQTATIPAPTLVTRHQRRPCPLYTPDGMSWFLLAASLPRCGPAGASCRPCRPSPSTSVLPAAAEVWPREASGWPADKQIRNNKNLRIAARSINVNDVGAAGCVIAARLR
jgi:hypothetical protein